MMDQPSQAPFWLLVAVEIRDEKPARGYRWLMALVWWSASEAWRANVGCSDLCEGEEANGFGWNKMAEYLPFTIIETSFCLQFCHSQDLFCVFSTDFKNKSVENNWIHLSGILKNSVLELQVSEHWEQKTPNQTLFGDKTPLVFFFFFFKRKIFFGKERLSSKVQPSIQNVHQCPNIVLLLNLGF